MNERQESKQSGASGIAHDMIEVGHHRTAGLCGYALPIYADPAGSDQQSRYAGDVYAVRNAQAFAANDYINVKGQNPAVSALSMQPLLRERSGVSPQPRVPP